MDLAAEALSITKPDRTSLRNQFISEVTTTRPPVAAVAPIYAVLLPPMPSPARDDLKWLTQNTIKDEVVSDGVLLRTPHGDQTVTPVRAVWTDRPAGRHQLKRPDDTSRVELGQHMPLVAKAISALPSVLATDYELTIARGPVDLVWFDEVSLAGPLYHIADDVWVRAWHWAICAGRDITRVHIDRAKLPDGRYHPHRSAVFLELRSGRFARLATHPGPARKNGYVASLGAEARRPGLRYLMPRIPTRETVRRHLFRHASTCGLSDQLLIRLYRYCI